MEANSTTTTASIDSLKARVTELQTITHSVAEQEEVVLALHTAASNALENCIKRCPRRVEAVRAALDLSVSGMSLNLMTVQVLNSYAAALADEAVAWHQRSYEALVVDSLARGAVVAAGRVAQQVETITEQLEEQIKSAQSVLESADRLIEYMRGMLVEFRWN
jgi:hypothetical protein